MRVLFTAVAGTGHVHPLLPLAVAVHERGHDVVFAAEASACAAIQRHGLRAAPAGLSAAARAQEHAARFGIDRATVPPREHADMMFPYGFGAVATPPMVDALHDLTSDWRPDLLVHDATELAAVFVAAELGVRHASHSFGTTPPAHRLAAAGEQTRQLWDESGLEQPELAGLFSDVFIDIRPSMLPGHPPAGTHVIRERPAAGDIHGGELPEIATGWDDRPLVYVTFGTVMNDPELLRRVLTEVTAFDVRVIATVGPGRDPAEVGEVADNVHMTSYVPQGSLFPHCDVVISHAGSGTFLGAYAHGIPQLCLPRGADQFLNADAAADIGAAISIEPDAVDAASIRAAVSDLLMSSSYRSVAREIAAEIAAMPSADDVAAELEQL
jgi:UDP:flavonoid glycosyltransferase YjiC (YdhE family)